MSLVFYFPHRQLWARCRRSEHGRTEVVLRTISSRSYAVTSELEGLASELSEALSATRTLPIESESRVGTLPDAEGEVKEA
jgi:hypothetical protein